MEATGEMSLLLSDKMQVSPQDASAWFPEEDWKLLQDWQKELYRNVMREVHRALLTLGPLIASTVSSLRENEEQAACPVDSPESARRPADDASLSPEYFHHKDAVGTDGGDDCHSAGDEAVSLCVKEEASCAECADNRAVERNSSHTGLPVITSVCSKSIKPEERMCIVETREPERRASDKRSIASKRRYRHSLKSVGEKKSNAAAEELTGCVLQSFAEGTSNRSKLLSETIADLQDEKTTLFKTDSSNLTQSDLYRKPLKPNESHTCLDDDSDQKSANIFTSQPDTLLNCCPYVCTPCQQHFVEKRDLQHHQETHQDDTPTKPEKSGFSRHLKRRTQFKHSERSNVCTVCAKGFTQKGSLTRHHRTHSGVRYTCSECEKSFTRKEILTVHMTKHTGETPYQCTDCGKSFSHKEYLISHRKQHASKKPYKCTECGKGFRHNCYLIIHARSHTGEKPYQCSECDKSFSQKGYLSIHRRSHTGEKPYQCTECDKSFSQKGYLSLHERTHTGEKPYHCTECDKSFSRKRHLTVHKGRHTAKTSYQKPKIQTQPEC